MGTVAFRDVIRERGKERELLDLLLDEPEDVGVQARGFRGVDVFVQQTSREPEIMEVHPTFQSLLGDGLHHLAKVLAPLRLANLGREPGCPTSPLLVQVYGCLVPHGDTPELSRLRLGKFFTECPAQSINLWLLAQEVAHGLGAVGVVINCRHKRCFFNIGIDEFGIELL